jgi:hypothetical protein
LPGYFAGSNLEFVRPRMNGALGAPFHMVSNHLFGKMAFGPSTECLPWIGIIAFVGCRSRVAGRVA